MWRHVQQASNQLGKGQEASLERLGASEPEPSGKLQPVQRSKAYRAARSTASPQGTSLPVELGTTGLRPAGLRTDAAVLPRLQTHGGWIGAKEQQASQPRTQGTGKICLTVSLL